MTVCRHDTMQDIHLIKVLSFTLSKLTPKTPAKKAADNQARSPINLHSVKLPVGVFK
ncbi:hypothetical protein IMY05_012G0011300 [Salix suchowensis]|nr:hypothetical protein IMY05_012G0011300 [Salix suchowensis]